MEEIKKRIPEKAANWGADEKKALKEP